MCGRYVLQAESDLEEMMKLVSHVEEMQKAKTGEIFPTDAVPVITSETSGNKLRLLKWGFLTFDKKAVINARSETVDSKPLFRDAFLFRRCLVPANAYFEWAPEGNRKVKYLISVNDRPLFYMAGLFGNFTDRTNALFTGFVVLTTESSPSICGLHDRMPVILKPGSELSWLTAGGKSLLQPYCDEALEFRAVR